MNDRDAVTAAAEALADGGIVDWSVVESSASTEGELRVIRGLRRVSDLLRAQRTPAASPEGGAAGPSPAESGSSTPATWGHLQLLERIGAGTSGDVYRAWDPVLDREVALKVLRCQQAAGAAGSGIVEEGRLLARVKHPNVVAVFGAERIGDSAGIWMEFIHGCTLETLLQRQGPLGAHEICVIALQLSRALAAIHAAGLLHRDIKAQNVMREDLGRIVLMDLGAGREAIDAPGTPGGDLAGTPLYLAPEVLRGAPASVRSDVYSLGILLYHLATNSYPVLAMTVAGLREAHAAKSRRRLRDARPDLPESLVRVIERATAADPRQRYDTAGALEAALIESLSESAPARSSRRRVLVMGLLGLAAMLVGALAWTRPAAPAATPAIRSIAVLPLENISADPQDEYFADGVTESLTGRLARMGSAHVISHSSMIRFRHRSTPLPNVARELSVDAVVSGSIGRAGDRVTLRARVIDSETGRVLWNESFEAPAREIPTLEDTVVRAILGVIGGNGPPEAPSGNHARAIEPTAHESYLRGRYFLNQRRGDALLKSVSQFEQALGIEPTYARAYSGLADAFILLGAYGVVPMKDAYPKARAAALEALRLDETMAEAHVALAAVAAEYDWKPAVAETHFRRAITLNPSYAVAHQWYADLLSGMLRHGESIREATRAYELDPLSPMVQVSRAVKFYEARQYQAAIQELKQVLLLHPDFAPVHTHLGLTYVKTGAHADAIAALSEAQRLGHESSSDILALLGYAYAAAGRSEEARNVLRQLLASKAHQPVKAFTIATIHGELGELDHAFAWLERAYQDREWLIPYMKTLPTLDALRGDPRFPAFLARVGLQ